jgi:hypothetical protein
MHGVNCSLEPLRTLLKLTCLFHEAYTGFARGRSAVQCLNGYGSFVTKQLPADRRYYIETTLVNTDASGFIMLGFLRPTANLANMKTQYVGQQANELSFFVNNGHRYNTINSVAYANPAFRMNASTFIGRKVGLLLDLTGATGVVHLFFNDVAGGNMVHRGVLACGLPKEAYRFGVSMHTADARVSWIGSQDQEIAPATSAVATQWAGLPWEIDRDVAEHCGYYGIFTGPLGASQTVGGWNSFVTKQLLPDHRYYIETTLVNTDASGHIMLGFLRPAANLVNLKTQHIGQQANEVSFYVHNGHRYNTINSWATQFPLLP